MTCTGYRQRPAVDRNKVLKLQASSFPAGTFIYDLQARRGSHQPVAVTVLKYLALQDLVAQHKPHSDGCSHMNQKHGGFVEK